MQDSLAQQVNLVIPLMLHQKRTLRYNPLVLPLILLHKMTHMSNLLILPLMLLSKRSLLPPFYAPPVRTGIQELKSHLHQHFEMKDLGPLSYFLGLEVTCGKDGYYLSQIKYASDLLSRAQFTDSKVTSRLLDYNVELTPANGILLSTISWLKVSCI
ncbi:uncharacterized protein LOC116193596 isoform X1 [Punica granatum]|uniref:Uncharacterized protein LOC116193596 isoform X1 n=1 Tax=Punica granatum TaxID=22663 RepID=A0A6P8C928_PUNGR|nr:uncharacterized protein LOC116193596 isoform X1 [Punica granatum]